jgi:hypothetical protein
MTTHTQHHVREARWRRRASACRLKALGLALGIGLGGIVTWASPHAFG